MNLLAYVVWASLFAMPGLLAMSLVLEGPARIVQSVTTSGWIIWATLLLAGAANTLFGYSMWAWLLAALSGGDGGAHVAAGADIRHRRVRRSAA